jgi:hypothetical protein
VIASDLALKSQVVGEIDYTLFGGGTGMVAAPHRTRSCAVKSLPFRRRSL